MADFNNLFDGLRENDPDPTNSSNNDEFTQDETDAPLTQSSATTAANPDHEQHPRGQLSPDPDYQSLTQNWIQELNTTELLPYDSDNISMLLEVLAEQEDTIEQLQSQSKTKRGSSSTTSGGGSGGRRVDSTLASIAASICKVDSDRLNFLLTDLTRVRLNKIESFALHNREVLDRMGETEIEFLRSYGELFESHMQRSVTDHLPKEAWKNLDDPEMIDRPNLHNYVFCRVIDDEGVEIDNHLGLDLANDDYVEEMDLSQHVQHYEKGSDLFVRYGAIRELVLDGRVELLILSHDGKFILPAQSDLATCHGLSLFQHILPLRREFNAALHNFQSRPHPPAIPNINPVNTSFYLDIIRALNISSSHRQSHESSQGKNRQEKKRIGTIASQVAELVPDAVEWIPRRYLSGMMKESINSDHVDGESASEGPLLVVNDQELFMHGVGATKELIQRMDDLYTFLQDQKENVKKLYEESFRLEQILTNTKDQEADLRMKASMLEAEMARQELEIELKRAIEEEEYVTAEKEAKLEQIRLNEKITRENLIKEDEAARKRVEHAMKSRLEKDMKVELSRREAAEELSTIQHERDLAMQRAKEKMREDSEKIILEAKAEAERANADVHIRKMKEQSEQNRKRNVAVINAVANQLSVYFKAAADNPKKTFTFIGYMVLLAIGVFTARETAKLCRLLIESIIGKPKLIRETTKAPFFSLNMIKRFRGFMKDIKRKDDANSFAIEFEDVILPQDLKERIISLATSASKVRKNKAPHRHVLFYGLPGTGKTMVAKKLAQCVGMEYAFMSGGDVGPLGSDAVTQIHSLFTWAKMCKKGVLLFIDEAEAFLGDRTKINMSENAHNALNALLYNTGTERTDFMMVLATNRAENLDSAVLDRCDESIYFPLPDLSCRSQLLSRYFDSFVRSLEVKSKKYRDTLMYRLRYVLNLQLPQVHIESGVMSQKQIMQAAKLTDGFSGREIAKLMIAIQGSLYASIDMRLTLSMVQNVIDIKIREHREKEMMIRPGSSQKRK